MWKGLPQRKDIIAQAGSPGALTIATGTTLGAPDIDVAPTSLSTTLITGGTGFVGGAVVRVLQRGGASVRVFARPTSASNTAIRAQVDKRRMFRLIGSLLL